MYLKRSTFAGAERCDCRSPDGATNDVTYAGKGAPPERVPKAIEEALDLPEIRAPRAVRRGGRIGACLLACAALATVGCAESSDPVPEDASSRSMPDVAVEASVTPACIELTDDIREDTTWEDRVSDPDIPDYCVRGSLTIRTGAALSIAPGTLVSFGAASALRVDRQGGALSAVGTPDAPITLRGSIAEAGWWQGVEIMTDDPRNRIEHVRISDAGGGGDVLAENELGGIAGALILDAQTGSKATAAVANVTFERNLGFGLIVELTSELRAFEKNAFIDNADGAAVLSQHNVHLVDPETTFSGNGFDGILVTAILDSKLSDGVTWRALSSGSYWIRESLVIRSDLTIESGASLLFAGGTKLLVDQNLENTAASFIIAGTAEAPVTLMGEETTPGFWRGLEISSGRTTNRIEHAEIAHAVKGVLVRKDGAFPAAYLDIRSTTIRDSSECGIENTSASNTLTVTEVTFVDNTSDRCDP